ncbi:extracellular solute-binding protein [Sciscionella sediminilitoris]|uniref:extracellular solute-binding protein n=1 Tax=Sciscionella sediminilitoris TaxID=1445613 RepID=UPI0004DF9086|nr:extracellular solute-binding protein [Sciscionella sp. SE31]
MPRRTSTLLSAVTILALLTGCAVSEGGANSLVFVSYGHGAYQTGQRTAWLEPYQAETGTTVTIDGPSSNAKLKAMVEAGKVSWDVVDTDASAAAQACGSLLEPVDMGAQARDFPPGTLTECGVPDAFFGMTLMYDAKVYRDHPPRSLADFFDPDRFPGRRIVYGGDPSVGTLETALLADGVPRDRLYPLDVPRALRMYDRIRPELTISSTYGDQQQRMAGGQADMALIVSARAYSLLADGADWKVVPGVPIPVTWDVLVVPKGTRRGEQARQLIRYVCTPARSAAFAELSGAGPANKAAKPRFPAKARQLDFWGSDMADRRVLSNVRWWAANRTWVAKAWSDWTTG